MLHKWFDLVKRQQPGRFPATASGMWQQQNIPIALDLVYRTYYKWRVHCSVFVGERTRIIVIIIVIIKLCNHAYMICIKSASLPAPSLPHWA